MKINKDITIGSIVAEDIRVASIFQKYGLDFCCGGNKTLQVACLAQDIDIESIISELNEVNKIEGEKIDYQSLELDELVTYIIQTHHRYINEKGPITAQFIEKVAHVHGERHHETVEIARIFKELLSELGPHMMKEEKVLFPYIMNLVKMEKGEISSSSFRQFVSNPIRVMMMEHDKAGDMLKSIKKISNNYSVPVDACNTYKAAFSNLQEMSDDIILHIHLENNILFPKAVKLEENLTRDIFEK